MRQLLPLFTIICFLVFCNSSFAQSTTNLSVQESKEYDDKEKSENVVAIYTSESGKTIIVRNGKKDFSFDVFNSDLSKIHSHSIHKVKKEEDVGTLFFGNKLKLFTVYAPKSKERVVLCHTIDIDTYAYEKSELLNTNVEKGGNLFGKRRHRNTSFSMSPDSSSYAIATDNIRKNKNSYTVQVFNAETNDLIYKKSYQESIDKKFEQQDLYMDENMVVYSLGKLYIDGVSKKKKGKANYKFILNKVSEKSTIELLIDLDDEQIKSLSISQSNNDMHLLGFYSERNVKRIKGGCDFIIDTENFSVKQKKAHLLPKQVYDDLYGYRSAARKDGKKSELKNFDINHVLIDSKGGAYVVAEEFYVTYIYVSTGYGGYMQRVEHYDDILILKFDPNGDLGWARSVFKKAYSPSYNAFLKQDQLHIILNAAKNLKEKKDGRTKVRNKALQASSLFDIEYSLKGEVSYNKIQDNKGNEYYRPFFGTHQDDRFIMMSRGKRKKTFMILK
jgi:hypothetical protein